METLDIALVELETFEPHLNTNFLIPTEDDGEPVVLVLESVTNFPDHRPEDQQVGRKPFSMVFTCATHPLGQGTYQLQHEVFAPFLIFLCPIGAYENGHKLEAVFA